MENLWLVTSLRVTCVKKKFPYTYIATLNSTEFEMWIEFNLRKLFAIFSTFFIILYIFYGHKFDHNLPEYFENFPLQYPFMACESYKKEVCLIYAHKMCVYML